MKKWLELPDNLRNDKTKEYYDLLAKKVFYRFLKRLFDIAASFFLIIFLFLPSLIIGIIICIDSKGGPFFLQKRTGRYCEPFTIIKFRTMAKNSEGDKHITYKDDNRITNVGHFLRKTHMDEFPQLINIFIGQMSFVGTRPEVKQYTDKYEDEWQATLLMIPGLTSTASYSYDDEANILDKDESDKLYMTVVLPKKMVCNLEDIRQSNIFYDIKILWNTVFK